MTQQDLNNYLLGVSSDEILNALHKYTVEFTRNAEINDNQLMFFNARHWALKEQDPEGIDFNSLSSLVEFFENRIFNSTFNLQPPVSSLSEKEMKIVFAFFNSEKTETSITKHLDYINGFFKGNRDDLLQRNITREEYKYLFDLFYLNDIDVPDELKEDIEKVSRICYLKLNTKLNMTREEKESFISLFAGIDLPDDIKKNIENNINITPENLFMINIPAVDKFSSHVAQSVYTSIPEENFNPISQDKLELSSKILRKSIINDDKAKIMEIINSSDYTKQELYNYFMQHNEELSPIDVAVKYGAVKSTEVLIDNHDTFNPSLVFEAIESESPECLELLVSNPDYHFDMNDNAGHGVCPLAAAMLHTKAEIIKLLLDNGAYPNISLCKDNILRPLFYVKINSHQDKDKILNSLSAEEKNDFLRVISNMGT